MQGDLRPRARPEHRRRGRLHAHRLRRRDRPRRRSASTTPGTHDRASIPGDALEPARGLHRHARHGHQELARRRRPPPRRAGASPPARARRPSSRQTPAAGATGVSTDAPSTARFDRQPRRGDASRRRRSRCARRPAARLSPADGRLRRRDAHRPAHADGAPRASRPRYTATLTTGHPRRATASPMAAPVSWNFTTGTNLTGDVRTSRPPRRPASRRAAACAPSFSRAVDAATVTASGCACGAAGGARRRHRDLRPDGAHRDADPRDLAGRRRRLTPSTVDDGVRAADGAPLDATTWTFTTAATPPPPPAATGDGPAAGATEVVQRRDGRRHVRPPAGPATVTAQNVHADAGRRRARRGDGHATTTPRTAIRDAARGARGRPRTTRPRLTTGIRSDDRRAAWPRRSPGPSRPPTAPAR